MTGKLDNIKPFIGEYVEFMYGDISNLETCRKAIKNIDIVCHQAAIGSVPRSINEPLLYHMSNVNGFLNILISCMEAGIKRIVYASSSSVYGDDKTLPKKESNTGNILSPYGATKMIDEIYANVFTTCYGMEIIGLRYFNIFGPRQDPNSIYSAVIPKFINMIIAGKQPIINGSGCHSRDFTYVDNAVSANILAMTTTNNECFGTVFNIGTGGNITILAMYNIIKNQLNSSICPIFGPPRSGDILHSHACIDKAKDMLGYTPLITLYDGIQKTIVHVLVAIKNIA
jgi:UDP-N-acetylglucosamine 4-epimerase